jgi:predicted nucleic acid-binding protein
VIVVSDTSPLNYLVLINSIDVLPKLFETVYVPSYVMQELQHPRTPEPVVRWAQSPPPWLRICTPSIRIPGTDSLDMGEAQAISLATEMHASAILIDERKGRRIAKEHGFTVLGTITVLELASRHGLLDLASAFDALQRTTFQIAQSLIDAAIERDANWKLAGKNKTKSE